MRSCSACANGSRPSSRAAAEAARTSLLRAAPSVAEHGPALAAEAEELRQALLDLETSPTRTRKTLSSQVYRDRKGRKEY
ncbi:hypothetical protein Mesil_3481 (plasmid) [Allomeiothermus silvanus DSM 9946]|uniref:Uncharacterized protein n=1 Tax=Allomeiothermus silvanus (strain ATCC 700542 / DSM 9946 / NBRC 106475 / NCIMB 13440 / VI-R2) TaxID=526227 RepID=D7BJC9_ALLS1|nr:hypothetical protein [Allomeiothermus silvanus]ADH65285.1 hypothetical protein Mesil_3481 [Allomeiothermus silvanus DSM 9946]